MPLIKVPEAYCIVCHRFHLDCNCSNQIQWYGLKAVMEYNKEIKSGKRYWGYQLFYQQIKKLEQKKNI